VTVSQTLEKEYLWHSDSCVDRNRQDIFLVSTLFIVQVFLFKR